MLEYSEDILKKIFPIGTIVETNGYKEGLFKELEKIYIMENLIGTQLYEIVAEKGDSENIKCKCLDTDTEVMPYYENLCDTNPFNDNRFGG